MPPPTSSTSSSSSAATLLVPWAPIIAAVSVTAIAATCVYRAVQAGGRKKSKNISSTSSLSSQPFVGTSPSAILQHFNQKKLEVAKTLCEAIALRTISYEDEQGQAVSLVVSSKSSSSSSSSPNGGQQQRRHHCGGCACSNHNVEEAVGTPPPPTPIPSTSSTTTSTTDEKEEISPASPTPEAVARSHADLLQFHSLLERKYPLLHSHPSMSRHIVNELSLLFVWKNPHYVQLHDKHNTTTTTTQKGGICFAGHMDVVPVPDRNDWSVPPFEGRIQADPTYKQPSSSSSLSSSDSNCSNLHVWGRGAIDDKHSVISICEAMEYLLTLDLTLNTQQRKNESSSTTSSTTSTTTSPSTVFPSTFPYIVLAFGHDEELGGPDGAAQIASTLPSILTQVMNSPTNSSSSSSSATPLFTLPSPPFEWLLDEGLFLLEGFFPGHKERVAVVCVGEKGHVNVELRVELPAGHSSIPPLTVPTTGIGILARAITRVESSPFTAHKRPANQLLEALLPGMQFFPHRLLFANLWLTWPIAKYLLLQTPASAALLRTTTAVTLAKAGIKSNVLPPLSTAIINHRIHPNESVESVLKHDTLAVNDSRVTLTAYEALEPAPVSSVQASGFQSVRTAIHSIFDHAISVVPGMMLGNTDTRHYWTLAKDIYRHVPTELDMEGTRRFHGKDERLSVDNLAKLCAFYTTLMCMREGNEK